MLLKRIYKMPDGWVKKTDEHGNCTNQPPLDYISVGHTGTHAEQNFSVNFVADGMAQGWLSISGDTLTLHAVPEDLHYRILRRPGRYCLHCAAQLPDDEKGLLARLHVSTEHPGIASPDPSNPAGYEKLNHFECVLDEKQHVRYRKKEPNRAIRFPRKETANG